MFREGIKKKKLNISSSISVLITVIKEKCVLNNNNNNNCRVTNCSPHPDGNRKWAQQAQYNKFVREWVKGLG